MTEYLQFASCNLILELLNEREFAKRHGRREHEPSYFEKFCPSLGDLCKYSYSLQVVI